MEGNAGKTLLSQTRKADWPSAKTAYSRRGPSARNTTREAHLERNGPQSGGEVLEERAKENLEPQLEGALSKMTSLGNSLWKNRKTWCRWPWGQG